MSSKEDQFYEWILGRGEFPYFQDSVTIPYPIGYTPIEIAYIPSEEKIEVKQ